MCIGRLVLLLLLVSWPLAANAQTSIPRTVDGHPDFSGYWGTRGLTPMERLPGAAALVATDEEARTLAAGVYTQMRAPANQLDPDTLNADIRTLNRVGGQWRTSMITDPPDGKLPFTQKGRQMIAEWSRWKVVAEGAGGDGPEARPIFERCLAGTGRAPLVTVPADNARQIVQAASSVVIYSEEGADVRIFGIGGRHVPNTGLSWWGDTTAHWEADVLVAETARLRDQMVAGPTNNFLVGPATRVTERFRFISPDEIDYQFTIDDPAIYLKPWTAEYSLNRLAGGGREYACAEGNYSLPGILHAARLKDGR